MASYWLVLINYEVGFSYKASTKYHKYQLIVDSCHENSEPNLSSLGNNSFLVPENLRFSSQRWKNPEDLWMSGIFNRSKNLIFQFVKNFDEIDRDGQQGRNFGRFSGSTSFSTFYQSFFSLLAPLL